MFAIAKQFDSTKGKQWKYLAGRTDWTDEVRVSGIHLTSKRAFDEIDLLPDGSESGAIVVPVTIAVDHRPTAVVPRPPLE